MDTIIALSSGALPAGVAVIRASGPASRDLIAHFCGAVPEPRVATLKVLRDAIGDPIDSGIVLWMPAPRSFTGEDSAEFQLHGSRAVIDRVLELATAINGVRLAEPGEYARRAFGNGKLDLTEAEGLGDLIEAETEAQRRFAVQQISGAHRALYDGWREDLLHARAMIEAEIDFADEEDVPGSVSSQVWARVAALGEEIDTHLASEKRGAMMREGFHIALVGPPNAGKSTLLNRLAGSERAIVSAEPGTTRDIVEARLDLGGYLVIAADTAGLREGEGAIEQEGIRRALQRAKDADLVLYLDETGKFELADLSHEARVWRVATKVDLARPAGEADHEISALTGAGVDALLDAIIAEVGDRAGTSSSLAPSRQRHTGYLRECHACLMRALDDEQPLEMRAEELRLGANALGSITGAIGVEEMLGAIFSSFCIGK